MGLFLGDRFLLVGGTAAVEPGGDDCRIWDVSRFVLDRFQDPCGEQVPLMIVQYNVFIGAHANLANEQRVCLVVSGVSFSAKPLENIVYFFHYRMFFLM